MKRFSMTQFYKDVWEDWLIPKSIKGNFRTISRENEAQLSRYIIDFYLNSEQFPQYYAESDAGREDLEDHLRRRLQVDRCRIIPWLDTFHPLKGARVLEIGCGTGASTVALAEQGARITAVDVHAPSIRVAQERCRLYALDEVVFLVANACDLQMVALETFDYVIFFACIEHMTLEERVASVSSAWARLRPEAYLVVVDTPNRLWWYDSHTSLLPFFNWLPDDFTAHYSQYSPRRPFNQSFRPPLDRESQLDFSRTGRAASYHEFEIAIPDLEQCWVGCMNAFLRKRDPLRYLWWIVSRDGRYERLIERLGPELAGAFYAPYLTGC